MSSLRDRIDWNTPVRAYLNSPRTRHDRPGRDERSRSPRPQDRNARTNESTKRGVRRTFEQIFEGLPYHFLADDVTDDNDKKEIRRFCAYLNNRGAKGLRRELMDAAAVIFVLPSKAVRNLRVNPPSSPKTLHECYRYGFENVDEIYHYLAARSDRDRDSLRRGRKRVVQSGWIDECIAAKRMLWIDSMCGWEIEVDYTVPRSSPQDRPPLQVGNPRTSPPAPERCPTPELEPIASTIPGNQAIVSSIEETDVASLTIPTDNQLDIVMDDISTSRELVVAPTSVPAPTEQHVLAAPLEKTPPETESEDVKPDTRTLELSARPVLQDCWRPVAALPREAHQVIEHPSPHIKQERSSTPATVPGNVYLAASVTPTCLDTRPSLRQQMDKSNQETDSATARPAELPLPTGHPAAPSVPLAAPVPDNGNDDVGGRDLHSTDTGVFAREFTIAPTFHVLDADTNQVAVMLITKFGGARIVPLREAAVIVVPGEGMRQITDPDHIKMLAGIDPLRPVVSIDWVAQCLKEHRAVRWEPFRMAVPTASAPEDAETSSSATTDTAVARTAHREMPETSSRATVASTAARRACAEDDDDGIVYVGRRDVSAPRPGQQIRQNRAGMPTPPRTPATSLLDPTDDRQHGHRLVYRNTSPLSTYSDVDMDEHAEDVSDDNEENDEDYMNAEHAAGENRKSKTEAEPVTVEHVADQEQRNRLIANVGLKRSQRWRFDTMLQELEDWGQTGFQGSFKSLYSRMDEKHGDHHWKHTFRVYKYIYYQLVKNLQLKGRPGQRGVKT